MMITCQNHHLVTFLPARPRSVAGHMPWDEVPPSVQKVDGHSLLFSPVKPSPMGRMSLQLTIRINAECRKS